MEGDMGDSLAPKQREDAAYGVARAHERPAAQLRVFIGSASDKLPLAQNLKLLLERQCSVQLWTEASNPSAVLLTHILSLVHQFDAGIFIFSGSDVTESHGELFSSVRDNVVFEVGVFMGGLGAERTFLLVEE